MEAEGCVRKSSWERSLGWFPPRASRRDQACLHLDLGLLSTSRANRIGFQGRMCHHSHPGASLASKQKPAAPHESLCSGPPSLLCRHLPLCHERGQCLLGGAAGRREKADALGRTHGQVTSLSEGPARRALSTHLSPARGRPQPEGKGTGPEHGAGGWLSSHRPGPAVSPAVQLTRCSSWLPTERTSAPAKLSSSARCLQPLTCGGPRRGRQGELWGLPRHPTPGPLSPWTRPFPLPVCWT